MVQTKGHIEINFPWAQLSDNGEFQPNEQQRDVLKAQLDEILKLGEALKPLR